MFSPAALLLIFTCYIAIIFLIALWGKNNEILKSGRSRSAVYSLSLAIYCTAWTYYGSVGKAATSGMLFLTIYLGPTVAVILGWTVLRKMIRIKNRYRITNIADLISARYGRSRAVAALATVIALVGVTPYIALQIKSMFSTFHLITRANSTSQVWIKDHSDMLVILLMILFTIIFGVRRLDPTERHQGMVTALAVKSVVKLIAFMAAGIFVTFYLFDGFPDIFQQARSSPYSHLLGSGGFESSYMTWTTYLILAASAILFLPRQFHISVVENASEDHIKTAMWLFPLYMFLINLFVFPIALGGLLKGYPAQSADTFVLALPLAYGKPWLTLLVFLGGVSAAMGMIIVSTMTLSTMIINHLMLPLVGQTEGLSFLRRHLLKCKWAAVIGVIFIGFQFERLVSDSYMLVNIGMISFAAVLQFAPAILGGLFWKRGNRAGALMGLGSGFLFWIYTLLIPSFVRSGWLSMDLLNKGPWGITAFRPERFMGVDGLDNLTHGLFWTLFFNIGFYVLGSLIFRQNRDEERTSDDFISILEVASQSSRSLTMPSHIPLSPKIREVTRLLSAYFSSDKSHAILMDCLHAASLEDKEHITISELVAFHSEVERRLSGSIGVAAAHQAMKHGTAYSDRESREMSDMFSHLLTGLKVTPADLKKKIDYYKEREEMLMTHAVELEEKIRERDEQIRIRKETENNLRASEARYHKLFKGVPVGIYRTTPDGTLLDANPALIDMLGYPDIQALKSVKTGDHYNDPEFRKAWKTQMFQDGIVLDFEVQFRKYDNSLIWVNNSARIVRNDQGTPLYFEGIIEDITERKEKDHALQESEARYRTLLEELPVGVVVHVNGIIEYANKTCLHLAEARDKSELENQSLLQFVHPEYRESVVQRISKMMETGRIIEPMEQIFLTVTGKSVHVEATAIPIVFRNKPAVQTVFLDIEARKQAEKELHHLRKLLSNIVNSMPSILIGIDKNSRVIQWNREAVRFTGQSVEKALGRPLHEAIPALSDEMDNIHSALSNGEVRISEKKPWYHGEERHHYDIIIYPIVSDEIEGAVIRMDDITQKINLQERMIQSEKMMSVGGLAAGMAHEINNPLAGILQNLQVIQNRLLNNLPKNMKTAEACGLDMDALKKYMEERNIDEMFEAVKESSHRAAEIVKNMLSFSKKGDSRLIPNDPVALLEKSLELAQSDYDLKRKFDFKAIEIVRAYDPDIPHVPCDPGQLQQVFLNILNNGAHAMAEREHSLFHLKVKKIENAVSIIIQDNGPGMNEATRKRIFEPFFTTKSTNMGTGLGLSVSYFIITENHKGKMRVDSAPGKGTTFTIELPV